LLTALCQQLLHQSVVTESATETKLTNRVQKMVAHTAVMEYATMVKPLRLALKMVA
jgi:hypothetical protein